MSEIVRLENVIKTTDCNIRIINGVRLCVQKGECVQIYGVPGSGKGTLMKLIAGLESPNDGKIFVLDKSIHLMSQNKAAHFRSKTFGISSYNPGFWTNLTIGESVAMPLAIRGISFAKRKKLALEQLKSLGLGRITDIYPSKISNYELQIASLARAAITKPEILLLNEITKGLSEKESAQILDILEKICESYQTTVVIFTATELYDRFANRRIVLNHGKIKEES